MRGLEFDGHLSNVRRPTTHPTILVPEPRDNIAPVSHQKDIVLRTSLNRAPDRELKIINHTGLYGGFAAGVKPVDERWARLAMKPPWITGTLNTSPTWPPQSGPRSSAKCSSLTVEPPGAGAANESGVRADPSTRTTSHTSGSDTKISPT